MIFFVPSRLGHGPSPLERGMPTEDLERFKRAGWASSTRGRGRRQKRAARVEEIPIPDVDPTDPLGLNQIEPEALSLG